MKKFNRFLLLFLTCSVSAFVWGQNYKVTEKSISKAPKWVGAIEKNYLIVSSNQPTIEACKEDILRQIKIEVASSVSQKVKASTTMKTSQTVTNTRITEFMDQLVAESSIVTENIPHLTAISLAKANDYYWEKHVEKKTKAVSFFYTVKYPFSELEIDELVSQYEQKEKAMNDELESYIAGLKTIERIEQIDPAIRKLATLFKYFTDERKDKVTAAMNNYRALYNSIQLQRVSYSPGTINYMLTLNGHPVSTSAQPTFESNCANDIHISQTEGALISVAYISDNCFPIDENYVIIRYKFQTKKVEERWLIQ